MTGRIIGDYQVGERVGVGGMACVYHAVDLNLKRDVALKVPFPELARQPEVVQRFQTEAAANAKLHHPNVAGVYTFLRQGDECCIVMEFVRGETLHTLISRGGGMSWETAIPLFYQILGGIDHAHRNGIIHRDIKPGNIMITDEGVVKITDFGIARVLGTPKLTRPHCNIGTIDYMSPERIRGEEVDERSDIYSLGIVLYEMLTGQVPFSGDNEWALKEAIVKAPPRSPRELAPHIPVAIERVILRAMAKKPGDRFASVYEFYDQLEAAARAPVLPGQRHKKTRLWTGAQPEPRRSRVYQTFIGLNWKHYLVFAVLVIVATLASVAILEGIRRRPPAAEQTMLPPPPAQQVPPPPENKSSPPPPVVPAAQPASESGTTAAAPKPKPAPKPSTDWGGILDEVDNKGKQK